MWLKSRPTRPAAWGEWCWDEPIPASQHSVLVKMQRLTTQHTWCACVPCQAVRVPRQIETIDRRWGTWTASRIFQLGPHDVLTPYNFLEILAPLHCQLSFRQQLGSVFCPRRMLLAQRMTRPCFFGPCAVWVAAVTSCSSISGRHWRQKKKLRAASAMPNAHLLQSTRSGFPGAGEGRNIWFNTFIGQSGEYG